MKRRALVAGATAVAAAAAGPAPGQRIARPVRLGFLSAGQAADPAIGQFRGGLARIGWVEGRDFVLKTENANLDFARLPALRDALLRSGIDILVATGGATRVVRQAERQVPVVFSTSGDPIMAGFVRSLARPGGNATGNSQLTRELVGKRLELQSEIAATACRTLVVQSPDHPGEEEERSRSQRVGAQLGLETLIRPVRDREALEAVLAEGAAAGWGSMLCFTDGVTVPNRYLIADHACRMRISGAFPRREFWEAGGLASYGPSVPDLVARLAVFVERIAGGMRPSDIPVEWPTLIGTIANKRTAEAIGVALPPLLRARADEVIE